MRPLGNVAEQSSVFPAIASDSSSAEASAVPAVDSARQRLWTGLTATCLFCACASVFMYSQTWTAWVAGKPALPGTDKDPALYTWFLVWTPFALTHHMNPLYSNYMVYPHQLNMMWNTSMEFVSFLMWPVTASLGPITAYNIVTTLTPIVTGGVTFLALRRHVSTPAAVLAAVFYAFCPELVGRETTHLVLAIAFYPPLMWILLEVIGTASSVRIRLLAGLGLGLATFVQLMIEPELLAVAAIGACVGVLYLAVLNYRVLFDRVGETLLALMVGLGTFLILGAVPLDVMLFGPGRLHGPAQPANLYVQDLAAVLVPGPLQAITIPASNMYMYITGNAVESAGYFGPVLLAGLLLISITSWRLLQVRWAVLMVVTLVVLSLGPEIHWQGQLTGIPMPWELVRRIPLLENLVSNRLLLAAYLPVALLLAVGIDALRAAPALWVRFAGAAGLVVVALSLLPARFDSQVIDTPRFFSSASVNTIPAGSPTLIVPLTDTQYVPVWQAEAGMRFRVLTGRVVIPNAKGASALDVCQSDHIQCFNHLVAPTNHLMRVIEAAKSNHLRRQNWLYERRVLSAAMRLEHIGTVIARPAKTQYEYVKLFTRFFGRPPAWYGQVAVWPRASYPSS